MCTLAILLTGAIAFADVASKAGHEARPLPGVSATLRGSNVLGTAGEAVVNHSGGQGAARVNEYMLDDGSSEQSIGLTAGGTFFYFNQFNVLPAKELIVGISMTWGSPAFPGSSGLAGGEAVIVRVYQDNNGNGDPTDTGATQVAQGAGTVAAGSIDTDIFQTVPIFANCLGMTSIYIGVEITHPAGGYPASQDTATVLGRSWAAFGAPYPGDLTGAINIDAVGLPGTWLVRADAIPSVLEYGACCNEPLGVCAEGASNADCFQIPGARFLPNGECDDFDPPCGFAPGACCFEDATCVQVPQVWCRNKVVGDMDCDGDVDFFDIDPFVLALNGPAAYFAQFPACNWLNGDCDLDGDVDFFDIDYFVALLGLPPATYPATFLGVGTECSACPCAILCPPGSTQEQEPCGGDTNGGCNLPVPAFEPIACGETICGTMYSTSSLRDTDWYLLTLTSPAYVNISLLSEMSAVTGIVEPICYGGPASCDNITGSINPFLQTLVCAGGSISTECIPAGEYYVFVAPAVFGANPCEKDYNLRVTCEPCELPDGACCFFPSGNCTPDVTVYECACLGGNWQGAGTTCDTVDCPVPPPNDDCTGAEFLDLSAGPQLFVVNNTFTTDDGTPFCGTSAPYHGIWYRVTGAGEKIYMSTCGPATTNPDTKIQVFCGCDYRCVTGKDDDGTTLCPQNGFLTTIEWCGATGVDYYIIVGSYGSADVGDIQIAIGYTGELCTPAGAEQCAPAPAGDTCADPIVIPSLPYDTTNDSCLYVHQYNAVCPFSTAGSPDVVYQYTTGASNEDVTITLCHDATNYDTKLYVFAGDCSGTAIYCNDDTCSTLSFPSAWVSELECITLLANTTYYIVVDGYGSAECGTYNMTIDACVPCVVECPQGGVAELEPCGQDTNGGCNMPTPTFEPIACGETKCGTGWFDGSTRDTDWYTITLASPARITLEAMGEFDILIGVIVPPCPVTAFLQSAVADKCVLASLTTTDCLPAGTYYLFAAPQFTAPSFCPADYFMRVTCTPCAASYCSAGVSYTGCDEFISTVDIPGVLTNAGTGCGNGGPNGYSDYTGMSGSMSPGSSYPITVNIGPPNYSGDQVRVWVDWDHNLIFDVPAEETILTVDPSYDFATGSIPCPPGALSGSTRMRVRLTYTSGMAPCGVSSYGEIEDYTITVP